MSKIVAFMGFDGSGKTTTCKLVEAQLLKRGRSVTYIPGFEHPFLGIIKMTFKAENMQKAYNSGHNSAPNKSKKMLFKLWPLAVFVECWLSFLYSKFFRREHFAIYDRYFYDWLVSFEKLGYSSGLTRLLYQNFLPRPGIGIVFVADPKIAYSRKKHDHADPFSEYERQYSRYKSLAKKKNFVVVDTSKRSTKGTSEQVLKLILEEL